jgi:hypothetical protein
MDSQGSVAKLVKTVDYREAVHYKSGGSTGQRWPVGTWQDPCGSLASVRAILTARQLDRVWIHGMATLDADMTGLNWFGDALGLTNIDLNAVSVTNSSFKNMAIMGAAYAASPDAIIADDCYILITTNPITLITTNCIFTGATAVVLGDNSVIEKGRNHPDGETIFSMPGATMAAHISDWAGRLLIQDLEAGAAVHVNGVGALRVNGTGGTVTVRGDIQVTDLSGGLVTIDDQTSFAQRAAIKTDTAAILVAVTGGAADARFEQSHAGTVEEDAIQGFDISIFDIDAGAVASADINITAISAVMEKSTGGGAFSSAGITQPTFLKADGRVYVAYRFLAAEWAVGDLYRLRVTDITATVDSVVVHVPAMVWSNAVIEAAGADTKLDAIGISTVNALHLAKSTDTYYADPDQAADTGAGTAPGTAKKWTDSAIGLCADGDADVIVRLPGAENIDDDDSDPAIVCDKKGIVILGIGGGNPGQQGEVNGSIRRRQNATWAAAAGPAVDIQKPCSIIGLEVVASGQNAILISGEGGGEAGGFSLIELCRFVGWSLMTEAVHFDAGAYNKVKDCRFESLTAGIMFDSTLSNNPDYNEIIGCIFQGCAYGIDTDAGAAPHNTRVVGCTFLPSSTQAMTKAIRTRGLWDSGEISGNKFSCNRADAYDQTVAQLRAQGVRVWGNEYLDGTDAILDKLAGATGIFFEQADVPVTMNATNVEADILDLSAASTRYILRDLILECADPGAETVTITLYRPVNDVPKAVKSFDITILNYTQSFTLVDMFDLQHLAGDDLRISAVATAAGPYALTGQYSYAKTNV